MIYKQLEYIGSQPSAILLQSDPHAAGSLTANTPHFMILLIRTLCKKIIKLVENPLACDLVIQMELNF